MLSSISPKKVTADVKQEQLRLLYKQRPTVLVGSILIASISLSIFWNVADHMMLLTWFLLVVGISGLRLLLIKLSNHNLSATWEKTHLIGTFLTGLSWGLLALFFDPAWESHYQLSLFVIFVGIISAAFISNSSYFLAFPTFSFPVIFCLIYAMGQHETEGFVKIIFLITAYFAVMYTAALKYNEQITNLLEMRFSNEKLSDILIENNLKLEGMAETDSLTSVFNRRSLDKQLTAEWSRHCRNKKSLAFLFIDADYFKQYNDTYGHEEGDKCLTQLASVIKENAQRSSDIVARYGGEEFCVVLPETEGHDAEFVAEKILSSLLKRKIPHETSLVSDYVTVSIGISSIVPDKNNSKEILRVLADKALYQAKNNGRNQCVLSEKDSIESEI